MVTAAATALAGALSISVGTATLIVQTGMYVGVIGAQMLLFQPEKVRQETGTKLKASFGGAVSQSIIFGEKETAGSLIYQNSWGRPGRTPNGMLVSVFCLSDMPSDSVQSRVWINGKKCAIDFAGGEVFEPKPGGGTVSKGYRVTGLTDDNSCWIKILDGTQTEADPYLRGMFGGHAKRPWKASMIGRGRTLAIVTAKYDKKEPEQWPQPVFVVRGVKLYDPRKDSTNGGSGSHRWGVPSTYEYTANPLVIAYNIMRGIYWNTQWMYGGQNWSARRFDQDTWFASMNACDVLVNLAAGGTERRYRMGAEIELSDSPIDNLDRIFASCNARFVESGGIYKVYVGDVGAPVFSFTDGQVVVSEKLQRGLFPTQTDICNTITGTYYEPNAGGQQKAYRKRSSAAYIAQDRGDVRSKAMNFDFVRSNTQAQRLARHALNDNRHFLTLSTGFTSLARKLEPGDVINFATSKRFGYVTKQFLVEEVTLRDDGIVLVFIREIDSTDANWTVSDELPYTVGLFEDILPDAQIKPITVSAITIKNGAGVDKKPALKIEWDVSEDDVDAKRMDYRVRLLDGDDFVANSTVSFEEGKVIISEGILRNETYQVQARLVPESGRPTDWTAWQDITALDVGDGEVSDSPPPAISTTPTISLVTRRHRDGKIRQRLVVNIDLSGRDARESYRVRVVDTTEDPDLLENFKTDEFPFSFEVQTNHSYTVRVVPVTRFGVVGTPSNAATGVTMPIGKKTTADGAVPGATSLSIVTGHRRNDLEWDAVDTSAFPDWSYTLVERDNSTAFSGVNYRSFKVRANKFPDVRLGNADQKYYRVTHYDTSDNPGAASSPINATTTRLESEDVASDQIISRTMAEGAVFELLTKKFTWSNKANGNKKYKVENVLNEPLTVKNPLNLPIQVGLMVTMFLSVKGGATRDQKPFGTISVNITRSDQKNPTNAGRLKGGGTTAGTGSANFIIPAEGGITLRVQIGATAKLPSSGSVKFSVSGRIAAFVPKKG